MWIKLFSVGLKKFVEWEDNNFFLESSIVYFSLSEIFFVYNWRWIINMVLIKFILKFCLDYRVFILGCSKSYLDRRINWGEFFS